MVTVGDVYRVLDRHYPMALKEPWDSSGVICGSWKASARKILIAIDITAELLDEAVDIGADCIITHHPLVLPRHSIVTDPWKFRVMARANTFNVALMNAHTNADHARPGVSDLLAERLGIEECDALIPTSLDAVTGTGRIGSLSTPMSLGQLVSLINEAVPGAAARSNGDPTQFVQRVAVCGGAGDSLLELVRDTDADVFVASDLRHHPVLEHVQAGGCALIDIEHSAAESVWLPVLSKILERDLGLEVAVSKLSTAAWQN
jgi:dinuclear metal center YbgI/SA1388 family protein